MSDPGLPFLFAGLAVVWVAIAGYVLWLARAQRRLDQRVAELERRGAARKTSSGTAG